MAATIEKSTRLRFIKAKTPEDLSIAVSGLAFKVEIKGGPVKDGKNWIVFFIPADNIDFKNVDLTQI